MKNWVALLYSVSAKDVLVINLVKILSGLVKSALSTNVEDNPCNEYASASAKQDFSVIWRLGLLRSSLVWFWIKTRAQKILFLFSWYQGPLSSQLYLPAAQRKQRLDLNRRCKMQIFAELCTINVEMGVVEWGEGDWKILVFERNRREAVQCTYDLFYNANTVVCWNTVLLSA